MALEIHKAARHAVPFVHGLSGSDEADWLKVLNAADPNLVVVPQHALSKDQRTRAQVAIVANPNPADLRSLPNLKWVHSLWAGVEKLVPALDGSGIQIARLIDVRMAQTMSEAVLTWSLYLHRDMPRYAAQQAKKHWQQWPVCRPENRTIGVLGLGELGTASATRLVQNGFHVLGWSRSPKQIEGPATFSGNEGLFDVLRAADILVILLPLTQQTTGLLGAAALGAMKRGARLINFARAAILDEAILVEKLKIGALDHAVLDVFHREPLPENDPLWTNPAVTLLPHISAPTDKQSAAVQVMQAIKSYHQQNITPKFVDFGRGY